MIYKALSGELTFPSAFEVWMSHRIIESNGVRTDASYIAKKTERDYRVCAKALSRFFGKLKLDQIHAGHLMSYQEARAINLPDPSGAWRCFVGGRSRIVFPSQEEADKWAAIHGRKFDIAQTLWAAPAGANCIRKEVALLIRILSAAGLWTDDKRLHFERLRPVESDLRRAMTIEEQHRFLHVAASRAEYRYIYQYAIVALQTTAGTNEMRSLRLGDVLLSDRIIQIPRAGAKNKYRMRAIPLVTSDAVWAMEGLIARARELGSVDPSHYLFPLRATRGIYDPARPMSESGLKKSWDAVRCAAGMPNLRIYDLRHTGITRMAESGVPLRVAMTFAGHMTARMQQRYEAICMTAKRSWGAAVWGNELRQNDSEVKPAEATPSRRPVVSADLEGYYPSQHFFRSA